MDGLPSTFSGLEFSLLGTKTKEQELVFNWWLIHQHSSNSFWQEEGKTHKLSDHRLPSPFLLIVKENFWPFWLIHHGLAGAGCSPQLNHAMHVSPYKRCLSRAKWSFSLCFAPSQPYRDRQWHSSLVETLIRSLWLGMKDWLDHPAVICASWWFPEEAGGKHKCSPVGIFTSRWDDQQQIHLHRAWLGCWQWGLRAIKDCMGLHL